MNDQQASPAVLVTGASGYLGGWCVVQALERGHQVRASVRNPSREQELRAMIESKRGSSAGLSVVEADLASDDGWQEAVSGCDYVLHVASPFPASQPKDPNELIVPAREGTLRVLRAAFSAGVKRVVVTSSVAAVRNFAGPLPDRPINEEDWTDPDLPGLSPYPRSKTIAERAAWDLAREQGATERLAVVNPSAILGPVLSGHRSTSVALVERLLAGMPGMPRLSFSVVDVRDVAEMHLLAMDSPQAGGQRFLAVGPSLWISEMAEILRERLGPEAEKVPHRTFPDALVRIAARFDPSMRSFTGDLGKRILYSNEKARQRLGWKPRAVQDTLVDCATSLIEQRRQEPVPA